MRVSELCLGTMTFGEDWGWGASHEESKKQFDVFADAGGNFIDTANLYTQGTSEKYVGEFIARDREHFVVATKYTLNTPDTGLQPNAYGNSRKNMVQAVEASLKRLNTDYIDLYYVHAWDQMTPIEEVVRAMDDLVRQGKVLYFAFSDTPSWVVSYAVAKAEQYGWTRPVGLQVPYSMIRRDVERALLPMARSLDIAVMPWAILGQGVLLGKYSTDHDEPTRFDKDNMKVSESEQKLVDAVAKIAEETGRSKAQVCVNWVRQQDNKAQIIPILGARTLAQLEDNLACLEWTLSEEQLAEIEEASDFDIGFPHTFISGGARRFIFGDTFEHIDNHHRL